MARKRPLRRRPGTRVPVTGLAAALIVLMAAEPAAAHALFVNPPAGILVNTDQALTMSVPHELTDSEWNVAVAIELPTGWSVVSCTTKPTWTCATQTVDGRQVLRYTKAAGADPAEDETFRFTVHAPNTVGSFPFRTVQTYNSGEEALWVGAAGSEEPAPVLTTAAAPATTSTTKPPPSTTGPGPTSTTRPGSPNPTTTTTGSPGASGPAVTTTLPGAVPGLTTIPPSTAPGDPGSTTTVDGAPPGSDVTPTGGSIVPGDHTGGSGRSSGTARPAAAPTSAPGTGLSEISDGDGEDGSFPTGLVVGGIGTATALAAAGLVVARRPRLGPGPAVESVDTGADESPTPPSPA